jgi:hypothetical protein
VSHSSGRGLPGKGRQKKQTSGPKSSSWRRRAQWAGLSSETTAVLPDVSARPARGPPARRRASSSATSVVLPDFHWLVSKVTLPGAR